MLVAVTEVHKNIHVRKNTSIKLRVIQDSDIKCVQKAIV